jgi:ADP-ribose pyrophosphatase YjhB (NUDIX family)
LFDLPGGTPENSESAHETLTREFLEEIGASVQQESDWFDINFLVEKDSNGNPICFEHAAKVCIAKVIGSTAQNQNSEDTNGADWCCVQGTDFFSPLVKNSLNVIKLTNARAINHFILADHNDRFCYYEAVLDSKPVWIKYLCSQDLFWRQIFLNEQSFYKAHACNLRGGINIPQCLTNKAGEYLVLEHLVGKAITPIRFSKNIPLVATEIEKLYLALNHLSSYDKGQIDVVFDKGYLLKQVEKAKEAKTLSNDRLDAIERLVGCTAFPLVICHGDFLLRNIIKQNDQFYIIDWEYFGRSVRFWDLATLWCQFIGKSDFQNILLSTVPGEFVNEFTLTTIVILIKELRLDLATSERKNYKVLEQELDRLLPLTIE